MENDDDESQTGLPEEMDTVENDEVSEQITTEPQAEHGTSKNRVPRKSVKTKTSENRSNSAGSYHTTTTEFDPPQTRGRGRGMGKKNVK
jgi:hypothetical protein